MSNNEKARYFDVSGSLPPNSEGNPNAWACSIKLHVVAMSAAAAIEGATAKHPGLFVHNVQHRGPIDVIYAVPADALCVADVKPPDDPSRCAVCGWQMADPVKGTAGFMCRPGDCSMRPRPENLYAPERAEAESRALRKGWPPPGREVDTGSMTEVAVSEEDRDA